MNSSTFIVVHNIKKSYVSEIMRQKLNIIIDRYFTSNLKTYKSNYKTFIKLIQINLLPKIVFSNKVKC